MDYEFLQFIESLNSGQKVPGELEHEWQMRRTTTISDTLFDLYQWVSKGDASRAGFDTWLKDKVLNWYT